MTEPVQQAGAGAGATTQAGPLGRVDAASPAPPTTVVRAPFGSATATVVVGLFGLIATLAVLGAVTQGVRNQHVFALDTWATPYLHAIASPALDAFMTALTDFGSTLVFLPVFLVVAAWLLWRRRFGSLLFLAVVSVGAVVLNGTMKLLIQRPRPEVPWAPVLSDYSFPSGHTLNAVVFYIALALIAWSIAGRRAGMLALAVAVLIAFGVGMSRIYLGYHYLTDVVGGFLAGIAWLLVVGTALRARPAWQQWRNPRTEAQPPSGGPTGAGARSGT